MRTKSGAPKALRYTFSDVAAASGLNDAGQGSNVLNGNEDVWITDLILSAAGTDTTRTEWFVNGSSVTSYQNANLIGTTVFRFLGTAPFYVPKGAQFNMIQRA